MKYSVKLGSVKINDVATIEGLDFQVEYAPEEIKVLITEILPFMKDMVNTIIAAKERGDERCQDLFKEKTQGVATEIQTHLHKATMSLLRKEDGFADEVQQHVESAQDLLHRV